MAALIEGVNRRRTRNGRDFVVAQFSDQTGQFSASCFEESLVDPLTRWAAEQTCLLLNVELDAPSPDEPPRITVRGARPLAEVTSAAAMVLKLDVERPEAFAELAELLQPGGQGEVIARLKTGLGEEPLVRLGRGFQVDGDLAEKLASIEGLANVALTARRSGAPLRLVA
jgi:DNA polymerase-3 subunit alpha